MDSVSSPKSFSESKPAEEQPPPEERSYYNLLVDGGSACVSRLKSTVAASATAFAVNEDDMKEYLPEGEIEDEAGVEQEREEQEEEKVSAEHFDILTVKALSWFPAYNFLFFIPFELKKLGLYTPPTSHNLAN